MNESNNYPLHLIPNIHLPENEKVLSYLKELHPFHEIIVPFSAKKVNDDITPPDFIGRFAAMQSLPANSKYVVYGTEALVHPETGIIVGFITGTSMIYRLPDPILREIRQGNIVNFREARESSPGMENLESNWATSRSITEQLVHKCFDYYGQATLRDEIVHVNFDVDLTTPRTREFEKQQQSRRLLPLGIILVICVLGVALWYAADYVMKLF